EAARALEDLAPDGHAEGPRPVPRGAAARSAADAAGRERGGEDEVEDAIEARRGRVERLRPADGADPRVGERRRERLEPAREEDAVAVEEDEDVAARAPGGRVPRRARAGGALVAERGEPRPRAGAAGARLEEGRGPVGRAVVDD